MKKTVYTLLRELGVTPGAIARKLVRLGIRGERYDAAHCPIAVYLQNRYDKTMFRNGCGVSAGRLSYYGHGGHRRWLSPTSAIRTVILDFDGGNLPELELTA